MNTLNHILFILNWFISINNTVTYFMFLAGYIQDL